MTPKSATAVKISSFIVTAEITATFSFYCLRKIHEIYLYVVVGLHFPFTLLGRSMVKIFRAIVNFISLESRFGGQKSVKIYMWR